VKPGRVIVKGSGLGKVDLRTCRGYGRRVQAGSRSPVASSEAAASETLARWYEAWNAHDVDAVSALMTENVSYEGPAAPSPAMRGRAAVELYVRSAFAGLPDLHLEKLEEWVTPGGEVISSYFRFSATFAAELTAPGLPPLAPTGGRLQMLGMDRSEIRDGRLARHQIFWDIAELSRQLGALPARGSRAERIARHVQRLTARRLRQAR
jgi:predicted ester cyclase